MRFKGDIIITDPCYIIPDNNDEDWDKCNYGNEMELLGIKNYICRDTIYGDWSCKTYNSDTKEELGEFCADAGMVAVFLLDEVLKYNPNFDLHKKSKWTTTLIENFEGEIIFVIQKFVHDEDEVRVIGKGNINFYTTM